MHVEATGGGHSDLTSSGRKRETVRLRSTKELLEGKLCYDGCRFRLESQLAVSWRKSDKGQERITLDNENEWWQRGQKSPRKEDDLETLIKSILSFVLCKRRWCCGGKAKESVSQRRDDREPANDSERERSRIRGEKNISWLAKRKLAP